MAFFGTRSLLNAAEAPWDLQKVVQRAITKLDFGIIDCYRGEKEQSAAFMRGASLAKFGESPHNFKPARAVDVIPYPFSGWSHRASFAKIKEAFELSVKELKAEKELPDEYELVYGQDWEWSDFPHIQEKNWQRKDGTFI